MTSEIVFRRFFADWSGNSVHLHGQGNEGRHDEFLTKFKEHEVPHIMINAKIYQASEKIFVQHIAKEWGLVKVVSMNSLEKKFDAMIDKTDHFHCVFVITNAEDLGNYKSSLLQHFFSFLLKNSQVFKLVTLSILPWSLIESRLFNFRSNLSTTTYRLPEYNLNELSNIALDIEGISQVKTSQMSVLSLAAYLPKNLNPVFLRKLIANRKPLDDDTFQRLPANVALVLICSYVATWNPPASDDRFFGEKGVGKKRAKIKKVREFHEAEAKQFKLGRLNKIYDRMHQNLLAKCGPFDPVVQIPILFQFGHLERVSDIQNLAEPKFRCSAPFDYVEKIFNDFIAHHTKRLAEKTTTEDFRSYLYDYIND